MVNQEYSEAIAETLDILEHTKKEDVNKIPARFMEFLKANTSKTYKPYLDHTKKIKDMNLKPKTIGLLSVINRQFWCNNEQREEFNSKLKQNEQKYQEEIRKIYNPDNLFKNKKSNLSNISTDIVTNNSVEMIEYKDTIFIKIKKWLKNFFK